jgi:hypothetical protein
MAAVCFGFGAVVFGAVVADDELAEVELPEADGDINEAGFGVTSQ